VAPKYKIGQKVIIAPVKSGSLSPRDSTLEPYEGQSGTVVDFYWITLSRGTLYLYTVRMDSDLKKIVLHEDELQAYGA